MVSTQQPGIHNEDIMISIFSFLPIMDLARCAAVCKHWHKVVTGSIYLWKGKEYSSWSFWRGSNELRTIFFALPLLHKVEVQVGPESYVKFYYPYLSLSVGDISDLRAVRDWPKVRCTYLSIHLNIAMSFFSCHSPIDLLVLEKLKISKSIYTTIKPSTRAECVISYALQLCPSLRELSICVKSLSADYLDTLEGMSRLRTLKINCNDLENMVFLRHCSEVLEELDLKRSFNVPSAAFADLRCLGNLQRLQLHYINIGERILEVAAQGLSSLVSVQFDNCDIPDLSFLRHCCRLREVSVEGGGYWLMASLPMGLGHLPASVRSLSLTVSAANADELSEALPRLPSLDQLSLSCEQLDRLDFLRGCPQLRHLRLRYSYCLDESPLLDLRHLSQLETLDLLGNSDELAVLSSVMPSLPQLNTLKVLHPYNDEYEQLLQDYPRLRTFR